MVSLAYYMNTDVTFFLNIFHPRSVVSADAEPAGTESRLYTFTLQNTEGCVQHRRKVRIPLSLGSALLLL